MSDESRVDLRPAPTGYPIKLVRDGTPAVLNGSGEPGELWYGSVEEEDRMRWLRLKLAEELGEYLVDGGLDELADALAVIAALAVEHGTTLSSLVEGAETHPRGGFSAGVMMLGRHPEFDNQRAPARVEEGSVNG